MAAAEQGTIISVNPEEVRLLHDPASVCNIADSHLECYYTVQAAVLGAMDAFDLGVRGHKAARKEPTILVAPFILSQKDGPDIVVGAFKHRSGSNYYYGVPAERVKDFKPPAKEADFREEQLFELCR